MVILSGSCASRGSAIGRARIINNHDDYQKISDGDILILKSLSPQCVTVYSKITGIISEVGSRTAHAAVVAREYNIPCLINVDNLFSKIKDKDLIKLSVEMSQTYVEVLSSSNDIK